MSLDPIQVKKAAHILGLSGGVRKSHSSFEELPLEGSRSTLTTIWLAEKLESYAEKNPQREQLFKELAQAFRNSLDEKGETKLSQFKNQKPVAIPCGWKGHAVNFMMYKGHIIFTDKGSSGDAKAGTKIYNIQNWDDKQTAEFIAAFSDPIESKRDFSDKFESFFKTITPIDISQKRQKRGTCEYVNPKGSIEGVLYVEKMSDLSVKNNEDVAKYAKKIYKEFSEFTRDNEVDLILDARKKAPENEQRNYNNLLFVIATQHSGDSEDLEKNKHEKKRYLNILRRLPDDMKLNVLLKTGLETLNEGINNSDSFDQALLTSYKRLLEQHFELNKSDKFKTAAATVIELKKMGGFDYPVIFHGIPLTEKEQYFKDTKFPERWHEFVNSAERKYIDEIKMETNREKKDQLLADFSKFLYDYRIKPHLNSLDKTKSKQPESLDYYVKLAAECYRHSRKSKFRETEVNQLYQLDSLIRHNENEKKLPISFQGLSKFSLEGAKLESNDRTKYENILKESASRFPQAENNSKPIAAGEVVTNHGFHKELQDLLLKRYREIEATYGSENELAVLKEGYMKLEGQNPNLSEVLRDLQSKIDKQNHPQPFKNAINMLVAKIIRSDEKQLIFRSVSAKTIESFSKKTIPNDMERTPNKPKRTL